MALACCGSGMAGGLHWHCSDSGILGPPSSPGSVRWSVRLFRGIAGRQSPGQRGGLRHKPDNDGFSNQHGSGRLAPFNCYIRRNESRSFKQRTLNELQGVMIFGAQAKTY